MILSISSSLKSFKPVKFHEGLNVLLSDTSPEASSKQTRNSAGKTSMIDIIHFLLGSDCDKSSIFRTDELIEHTFSGVFSFRGNEIKIERGGSVPSRIFLLKGFESYKDLPIKIDKKTEKSYISNENWKLFLGNELFSLPLDIEGTVFSQSYTPSFRSMFSYFVRRQNSGGFISPERQAEKQQIWDWQENLSYLFDLDWKISFDFQKIRSREKSLEELKKASKDGVFGNVIGSVAELRSKLTVAEKKAADRKEQLQNFQVNESYNELSRRAARCKTQMQAISRKVVSLHENYNHLDETLASEETQDTDYLLEAYSAIGVELPGVAVKRLEDVRGFYDSVLSNRKVHLNNEMQEIERNIDENRINIGRLDKERQGILKILESQGAMEDFLFLQKELAELEAEAASLKERFKAAEIIEGEKTQLDIDRGNIHRRLQQNYKERQSILDEIILLVTDAISELYDDREGQFEISATDRGPKLNISIEGDRGGGISNIEIFCFDLALLKYNSKKLRGPGFLIHDSHLFDGVDERQVARSLSLGLEATKDKGLQYIVTMNSDIYNSLPFSGSFNRKKYILKTRLSDKSESGGLFGFRFG